MEAILDGQYHVIVRRGSYDKETQTFLVRLAPEPESNGYFRKLNLYASETRVHVFRLSFAEVQS